MELVRKYLDTGVASKFLGDGEGGYLVWDIFVEKRALLIHFIYIVALAYLNTDTMLLYTSMGYSHVKSASSR